MTRHRQTSHWGAFSVEVDDGRVVAVEPHPADPAPSLLLGNIAGAARHRSRVASPAVRRGWLEGGPGPDERRGRDEWVSVEWDEALDLVATEIDRVRSDAGPDAIYAGSYGWASAGRFHHSQSQLRRFVNLIGGATASAGTYSTGAAERILPRVVGSDEDVWRKATAWPVVAAHTELLVCFGGLPAKNSAVSPGGVTRHTVGAHLAAARRRGMELELFSPIADDVDPALRPTWHALRPGTDVAVMAALAYVLVDTGRADLGFVANYCVGGSQLVAYLRGAADGVAKTPEWAEAISEVPATVIRDLAGRLAERRTLITTSWSLQRAEHGEQPVWMSIALAALVGQIGLPGGGFGNGYSSLADIGGGTTRVPFPALPGTSRSLRSWIPVARVADMLLRPGEEYEVDGSRRRYPAIQLVYWAGGNPFHHHQDLNRLRGALRRPHTVVVNEPYWTGMARHADVVLPATVTLERNDIAQGRGDPFLIAMQQALPPYGEARHDHDIFAGLADRLGVGEAFREGRDVDGWLRYLWDRWTERMAAVGAAVPTFDDFWAAGEMPLDVADDDRVYLAGFRADPQCHPLFTPSGGIELYSEAIAGFGYDDCPPHPAWLPPSEWLGGPRAQRFPLHLIANNPATRLHSQLDPGGYSGSSKVHGREPIRMHPTDAAARGIADGDVVQVANDRGMVLAGARLTDAVRAGVVQLSTGAWYDPDDPAAERPTCVHGNPNVLTPDAGTSRLAQACAGQHALVEVTRYEGPLPPIRAYDPPELLERAVVTARRMAR